MGEVVMTAERVIAAPIERVYTAIADYENEHHRFLPSAFSDYKVEKGGMGAGTVISFTVNLGGKPRPSRAHVTEPEPGSVLVETEPDSETVTTFTLTPAGEDGTRVSIRTAFPSSGGLMGFIERRLAPRLLVRVYEDELGLLSEYLAEARG